MNIKLKKPKVCNIDIHQNPNFLGASRIPVNTDLEHISFFLKEEINATKLCACPCCDYRRHMFRKLQEIVQEYENIKNGQYNICKCLIKNKNITIK